MPRCTGTTKVGRRCRAHAMKGFDTCDVHLEMPPLIPICAPTLSIQPDVQQVEYSDVPAICYKILVLAKDLEERKAALKSEQDELYEFVRNALASYASPYAI